MLEHPNTILRDLKVNDLTRISVPEAIKKSEQWTTWLINQSRPEDAPATVDEPGTTTIKVYSNGYRWVEVVSQEALNREGSVMGHCVGSYASQVASKQCVIYSLRDEKNEPHVTIEAVGTNIRQIKGKQNTAVVERYHDYVISFLNQGKQEGWVANVQELSNVGGVFYNGEIMKRDDFLELLKNQKPLREYSNGLRWRSVVIQDDVSAVFKDIGQSVSYEFTRLETNLLDGRTDNSLYALSDGAGKTYILIGVVRNQLTFVGDGKANLDYRGYWGDPFSETNREYCIDILNDLSKNGTINKHTDILSALGVLFYENQLLTRKEFTELLISREPKRSYPGGLEWTIAVAQEDVDAEFKQVGVSKLPYGFEKFETSLVEKSEKNQKVYVLKDSSNKTRALIAISGGGIYEVAGDGRYVPDDDEDTTDAVDGNVVREEYWPPCYDLLNELFSSETLVEHSEKLRAIGAVFYQDKLMSRDEFRKFTAGNLIRKQYSGGLKWINLTLEEDIEDARAVFSTNLGHWEYSLLKGQAKAVQLEDANNNPCAIILVNHQDVVTTIRGLDAQGKVETKYWSYCYDVLRDLEKEVGYLKYEDNYNRGQEYKNIGGYLIDGKLHSTEETGSLLLDTPSILEWPTGVRWVSFQGNDQITLEVKPYEGIDKWSFNQQRGQFYSLRDSGESSRVILFITGDSLAYLRGRGQGGKIEDDFKSYVIEFFNSKKIAKIDNQYLDMVDAVNYKGNYITFDDYSDIASDQRPVLSFPDGVEWLPIYTPDHLKEVNKVFGDSYKLRDTSNTVREIMEGKKEVFVLKDGSSVIGAIVFNVYSHSSDNTKSLSLADIEGLREDGKRTSYGDTIRFQDRGYFFALLEKLNVKDLSIYGKSLNVMKVGDLPVDREVHAAETVGRIHLKDYPDGHVWELLNNGTEIRNALKEMRVKVKKAEYDRYYGSSRDDEKELLDSHEEDVANKRLAIYCLRDRQDKGRVIIFLDQQKKVVTAIRGRGNGIIEDDYHHYVLDFLKRAKTAGVFKTIDENELLNVKSVMFDDEVTHRLDLPQEVMLVDAVLNHDLATVKKAMDDGIDPDVELDDGNTLIVHALLQGDLDIADELLNAGAHLENRIGDYGDTLLMHLIRQFHKDDWYAKREKIDKAKTLATIKYILKEGEDPNDENPAKETALVTALLISQYQYRRGTVTVSDYEMADLLFQYGASADYAYTKDGDPILIAAFDASKKSLEMVHYLLKHGASADVQERSGRERTALMVAIEDKRTDAFKAIEQMIANGADLEMTDADGRTALWYAVSNGKFKVAQYLLKQGADVNAHLKSGLSLMELAQNVGGAKLIKLLQNAGAK